MPEPLSIEETATGIAIRDIEYRMDHPQVFLNQVGLIQVADAQKHFVQQSFGGIPWPERYPNQNGAKLNVAGALSDAAAGMNAPKARRFDSRPAAMDTGILKNSISYTIGIGSNPSVTVGTTAPNAQITQEGGTSIQVITDAMRTTINGWLKRAGKAVRNLKKGGDFEASRKDIARFTESGGKDSPKAEKIKRRFAKAFQKLPAAMEKKSALDRLRFVFFKRKGADNYMFPEKKTEVNARPFIGVTDESRAKMQAWGARWFSTGKE